jgi:hypothetical protein
MGLKQGSSFLWVKRYVKEGSGKRDLSPLVAPLGQPGGRILYRKTLRDVDYLDSSITTFSGR